MIPILDAKEMRRADAAAIRGGTPSATLMENAAAALVEELTRVFAGWRRVVVVCGPGNNGGDGLAAARLLGARGVSPEVFTLRDPGAYEGDAADNALRLRAVGISMNALTGAKAAARLSSAIRDSDGVVDALFGTGLSRPLAGAAARAVESINRRGKPVVAADVPSGLSSDTGALIGPSVRARLTVAFGAPKPCHVFFPARSRCGTVSLRDIGIPATALVRPGHRLWITAADDVRRLLPPRPEDSHKGTFGRVAVLAGSHGKYGAALLAARGALRAGAGLVTVFCPSAFERALVAALPETMTRAIEEDGPNEEERRAIVRELSGFDSLVAGPGIGTARETVALAEEIVASAGVRLVADADFLNAFAGRARRFRRRPAGTVLTPHPGEAARLLGSSTRKVQSDRLAAARLLARQTGAVVLLKGAGSLTASPNGRVIVNPTGTPLMSTAGSGDVLAGAIGALFAGGLPAEEAVLVGAYLHGAAGQLLSPRLGDAGLLAHELSDALASARRRLAFPEAASSSESENREE